MANGQDILKALRRNGDGSWICIEPVTIDHPIGRIQLTVGTRLEPGMSFMGVNLASWLEEQYRRRDRAA